MLDWGQMPDVMIILTSGCHKMDWGQDIISMASNYKDIGWIVEYQEWVLATILALVAILQEKWINMIMNLLQ